MKDFGTATAWLDKSKLTKGERGGILSSLSYYGIKDEAAKWLDWISGQEESEAFDPSKPTANIILGWTQEDLSAAGEWINRQEEGARKNQSIQTFAEALISHEPAAPPDWAVTLPESSNRQKLLQKIHASFEKKDPAEAAAFAKKHGLSSGD